MVSDQMELLSFAVLIFVIEQTCVFPISCLCPVLASVSQPKRVARIPSHRRMWAVTPGAARRAQMVSDLMGLPTSAILICVIEGTRVFPMPRPCPVLESVGRPIRAAPTPPRWRKWM